MHLLGSCRKSFQYLNQLPGWQNRNDLENRKQKTEFSRTESALMDRIWVSDDWVSVLKKKIKMEGCKDKGNIENSTLCGWDAGGCISGTKKFSYFSEHWFGPNKAWKCSLRDLHDETAWKILNRKTSVTGVVSFEYTGSDGPTCRLSWYLSRDINLFHIRYKWHCQLLIWENLAFVLSDRVVSLSSSDPLPILVAMCLSCDAAQSGEDLCCPPGAYMQECRRST